MHLKIPVDLQREKFYFSVLPKNFRRKEVQLDKVKVEKCIHSQLLLQNSVIVCG